MDERKDPALLNRIKGLEPANEMRNLLTADLAGDDKLVVAMPACVNSLADFNFLRGFSSHLTGSIDKSSV